MAKMRTKMESINPEIINPLRERRQLGLHTSERKKKTAITNFSAKFDNCHFQWCYSGSFLEYTMYIHVCEWFVHFLHMNAFHKACGMERRNGKLKSKTYCHLEDWKLPLLG